MSNRDTDRARLGDEIRDACDIARRDEIIDNFISSIPIDETDLHGWLEASEKDQKWYWRSRDHRIEVAGAGQGFHAVRGERASAVTVTRLALQSSATKLDLLLCGRKFQRRQRSDDLWKAFPDEICSIPETMIVRKESDYRLHICRTISPDTDADVLIDEIDGEIEKASDIKPPSKNSALPELQTVSHTPEFDGWKKNVAAALDAIEDGRIEKIVLARRSDYRFDKPIDPHSLLTELMKHNRHGYAILWQIDPETAFVSLTPERLYHRDANMVSIDALSSTVPRGTTPEEDRRFEERLRSDDKLRREHQYVIEGVARSIAPLCRKEPLPGALSVFKLDRIQHLATSVSGFLADSVDDDDIIETLHPTPAVGGTPRDEIMQMITDIEGFDRGWYASPVGVIIGDEAEFAVGIRSALMRGRTVSVFSGAGIVRGSDPAAEWEEIESKDILQSLTGERAKP